MLLLPVWLACALGLGVAVALRVPVPPRLALVGLGMMASGAGLALILRRPAWVLGCALAGVGAAGTALGAAAEARARAPALVTAVAGDAEAVTVSGTLVEDASPGANGVRLRLAVGRLGAQPHDGRETVALTVGGTLAAPALAAWRAGRTLAMPAALRRPARYRNPGVPDDQLALARRGLVLVGSVKSAALVQVLSNGSWWRERGADLRAHVRAVLSARVAPGDPVAAAIATAILIGDRAGLDPALEDRLQAAGTYHVIAISGGNIAVLTALLVGLARVLRVPRGVAGPAIALLLVAHADLVGAAPSVTRATAMAVVYLTLRTMDQSAWSLNALAAAAGGLLLARPLALADAGFILSVGATAAIILLAGRLGAGPGLAGWRRAAAAVLAASLATEIVLLPVSATLFNRVTVAGLVLNLAAVPLMAVVQIAAMVTIACDGAVPALAAPAAWVTAAAARALVRSADLVEWWPWLALRTPPPAWWAAAGYLAAVAAALAGRRLGGLSARGRMRLWRGSVGLAVVLGAWIVCAPFTWRWPWRADGRLRVVVLDVGQGDSTLVEFPSGERWLVDAGGLPGAAYDIGERVVAPALWARGTGRLDALVLTHGDPDHVGGARAAMDDFRPAVYEGVPVPGHLPTRLLRERARATRRAWRTIAAPAAWAVGGVVVRAWHPPAPDWERQRVRNDDSVVLELRYGQVSIVLPGDIGAEVERALAPLMPGAPRRVLKAAHHGSAGSTSDAWLDALRPEAVVFSCGRDNRFGHPAASVSGRLADRGIASFRTDEDGQVVVETDGDDLLVSTFAGKRLDRAFRRANRDARALATITMTRRHDDTMENGRCTSTTTAH